jgi:hypothetical protein
MLVHMPGVLVYWCQGSTTWGTVHSLREALIVRRWGVFSSRSTQWLVVLPMALALHCFVFRGCMVEESSSYFSCSKCLIFQRHLVFITILLMFKQTSTVEYWGVQPIAYQQETKLPASVL